MLACQDDREVCGLHELCEGIDPWPELSAYWNAFDGKCAALEGLAQAWLNRWEDESGIYDHSYIWEEMCDLLKQVGPGLWD